MLGETVRAIARIAAGAAAVFLIGWWQGNPFVFLAVYGLGLSVWQAWQHESFARWLEHFGANNLSGRWGELAQRVSDRVASESKQKNSVRSTLGSFRDLAENFPDGIVMLDGDLHIVWFNAAAVTQLGLAPGDAGQRISNLIRHPGFFDETEQADSKLIIESPVDNAVSLSLELVDIATGRQVLVAKDVTAQQHSEAARHDFVANASHELRSPLTVIRGYLDALVVERKLDPVWRKPVQEMVRQAQRMSDLLTDLMDLSRLDSLQLKAEFNPIDMAGLVAHVESEARQLSGSDCNITSSADPDYNLLGEKPEILSAVLNLVANAIRYSGDDCRVRISWTVDEQGGHLAVRDNGIGIPEDDIPRLTERFYRVDKGRSRQKGGTGLGLAIVRNTLSRHEGRLEIQSKLAEGSVFICHFPASRIAAAADDVLAAS